MKKSNFLKNKIQNLVKEGFKNANRCQDYDKGRPTYPNDSIKFFVKHLNKKSNIVEVGAGTGIFTKKLLDNSKDLELNLSIVDPVEEMASFITKNINFNEYPNVKSQIFIQTASNIPVKDSTIDGIFAAQCFHWFANMETLNEFSRVLKKDAKIFFIWNSIDLSSDYMKELNKIDYKYNVDHSPIYEDGQWKKLMDNQNIFKLKDQKEFENNQILELERALSRYLSISYISKFASKSEKNKEIVKNEFLNVLQNHKDLKNKKEIELPHKTFAYIYEKK